MIGKRRAIQNKITRAILITSTAVLVLTSLSYIIYEYLTFREKTINRVSVLGEVVSNNITAALAFESTQDAYEILRALRAEENIMVAAIYDAEGDLFSYYPKDYATDKFPEKIIKDGYYFQRTYLEGYEPVVLGNKRIGTLYFKYNLQIFRQQFLYFSLAAIAVFIVSLLFAYILSSKLQKKITWPIITLASFARSISFEKDYSARAVKQTNDEIGLLTDSFNQMLAQIEQQSVALKENEKRFRAIAENIAQLAWMTDESGKIVWYNKRWYDYTGTAPEDMLGDGWIKVHHPDHADRVVQKFWTAINNGHGWEDTFPIKGKDGVFRWFLSRAVPIHDDYGNILHWFGTNTDISDIMRVEEALRQSEEFSRTIVESSPDCVIALDLNENILSINLQGQNMLEITHINSYLGGTWAILWPDNSRDLISEAVEKAKKGAIGHFVIHAPTLKGKYKWWDVLVSPVYGFNNNVERLVSVARDITVLKELEQQKDDFIGIASHELKTPVTVIKAYTQVLQGIFEQTGDSESLGMLTKMDNQLSKLSNLITDLLDVTKIEQGKLLLKKEDFAINGLINEVIDEMQRTSRKYNFIKELDDDIIVSADRDRIGQVITNFITNAIKYSPKSDKMIIKSEILNSKKVVISVQDFGVGLDEGDYNKVFERFYRVSGTGHEIYPGLGLGLFISAGIIERHGGEIGVHSTKGSGSVFYFSLPLR